MLLHNTEVKHLKLFGNCLHQKREKKHLNILTNYLLQLSLEGRESTKSLTENMGEKIIKKTERRHYEKMHFLQKSFIKITQRNGVQV